MSWIWEGALPFLGVLGSVVLFHEFGHFLAAKAFGITVEVFSVGFGPRIWGFVRRGTEYRISWVPLGGYVKLKGEAAPEDGSPPDPGDMMAHSRVQRFVVFVMGAVFNLATAFSLTTIIFMNGVQEFAYLYEPPVVGEVDKDSPAREAGILPGDRILTFGGKSLSTWKELQIEMLLSPGQTRDVTLDRGGEVVTTRLAIQSTTNDVGRPGIFPRTGVMVGSLQPGWPAEKAGLKRGDRLAAIDGVAMDTVNTVYQTIQGSPGKSLRFTIERDGGPFEVTIVPQEEDGKGRIGFVPTPPSVTRTYPLIEAASQSVRQNVESIGLVFVTFRKLLARELSFRAFSGPVDLYRFSGEAAEEGLIPFLQLIAFVSLQLGIINLFPIPPLDGGHLFTLTIEGMLRHDLSTALKERVMQAGLILLLLFMGTVIYFDISKNFFH
ncbi:MAG TPA: RIP metalloprotease RseP [Candidatus Cryosericum sp.]|nr:RIP metalloprotease RseP [Candidatus Cryosericum sp.]